ncbi:MAG: hypothetical protein RL033_5742 [Pseudomonadota bacterium]|jgi:hypothetical protein
MTQGKSRLFLAFLFLVALWLGAGVYHSVLTTSAWLSDPLSYVRHPPERALPDYVNPFPLLVPPTAIVCLATLLLFRRYRGAGRLEVMLAIGGALLVLVATAAYFVPALSTLLDGYPALSTAEVIARSRRWVLLNLVRLFVLAASFAAGLLALTRREA